MDVPDGECQTAGLEKQNEEEKKKLRKRIQTTLDEIEGVSPALCVLVCVIEFICIPPFACTLVKF